MNGFIHSVETCGTVDGPGLRYVVFFQGCPLRCAFCHNPDSWEFGRNTELTAEKLTSDILRYRSFIRSGGVTLSGGEPLAQPEFALEVLKRLKEEGIHTAIDTSGAVPLAACSETVLAADLILLDIKHIRADVCHTLTGQDNRNALAMLDFCEQHRKSVWIRHVVVPGRTDDLNDLEALAQYLASFTVIQRIELLPFHKMGENKWKQLRLEYQLEHTPEPDPERMRLIRELFARHGLNAA